MGAFKLCTLFFKQKALIFFRLFRFLDKKQKKFVNNVKKRKRKR